ncbi:MAG: aminotransferase class IV [Bacteroidales bacterium]
MLQLIESIKICNGKIANLERHQARVDRAFQELLPIADSINIESAINQNCIIPSFGLFKCRIVYSTQALSIELEPYNHPIIKRVGVVNLIKPIDYKHKYLNRDIFNKLRKENPEFDDIIIAINGVVTDSTFCNIALFDGNKWVTPSTPLLEGTKREQLLDSKVIYSELVRVEQLNRFKKLTLFNAMNEFNTLTIEINNLELIEQKEIE